MAAPIIDPTTLAVDAAINKTFKYQIRANRFPDSYGATSLPLQLSINTVTGQITGQIRTAGVYTVGLSATNVDGTGTADLVITATDEGGGTGTSGLVSVYQAKYWRDLDELLEFSDFDLAGQPVVSFNFDSIGTDQLAADAIENKLELLGGPGRHFTYVLPADFLTPLQARFLVRLGSMPVPSARAADFVLMGELMNADGLYLGDTVNTPGGLVGIRNMIFSGTAGANQVQLYVWNASGGGAILPKDSRISFRLFSNPSG